MSATETPAVQSPCVKVCTLDARAGLCLGCGRNIGEIERWARMSAEERTRIMAELPGRLAAANARAAATG